MGIPCGSCCGKKARPSFHVERNGGNRCWTFGRSNRPKTPGRFFPTIKKGQLEPRFKGPLMTWTMKSGFVHRDPYTCNGLLDPQRTGWSNALHTANNDGFHHCSIWVPTYLQHIGKVHISYIFILSISSIKIEQTTKIRSHSKNHLWTPTIWIKRFSCTRTSFLRDSFCAIKSAIWCNLGPARRWSFCMLIFPQSWLRPGRKS